MSERRYKDYDERFAKDAVFYIDAHEAFPKPRVQKTIYAYSDPECTKKVTGEQLKAAFNDDFLLQVVNTKGSIVESTGNMALRPLMWMENEAEKRYAVIVMGVTKMSDTLTIWSGDSIPV